MVTAILFINIFTNQQRNYKPSSQEMHRKNSTHHSNRKEITA